MSSGTVRTSNQSRASTKIAVGFLLLLALGYGGYRYWSDASVANLNFAPVQPSNVNLVGVDTSKGYFIVVANGIAHVMEGSIGELGSTQEAPQGEKKRIPIKDMLRTMQGESDPAGRFVMAMNDMRDDDLPAVRVYWSADQIRKAISGDAALASKLEKDINTKLDGGPLQQLRPAVLDRGIVIQAPVEVTVPAPEGDKQVRGTILIPFQSRLMTDVFLKLREKPNVTPEMQAGYYVEVAQMVLDDPKRRQNVAKALGDLVDPEALARKAENAERVINSMQVLINGSLIEDATYEGYDTPRGRMFDIKLQLTDEGRKRLWKYSKGRVGGQILFTVGGNALAAPRIGHELAQHELTIRQILLDEDLIKDAVDKIKQESAK